MSEAVVAESARSPELHHDDTAVSEPLRIPKKRGPAFRLMEVGFLLLGIAGIAGLVYGGALLLGSTVLSPQAWAERYVDLVAKGSLTAASELVDPGTAPELSMLLQDGALPTDAPSLTATNVELLEQRGSSAKVSVQFLVDGVPQEAELSLWRRTTFFGLASEWRVSTPLLGSLRVTTTGPDEFLIGDVPVTVSGPITLPVYPGSYPITLASTEFYTLEAPLEVDAVTGETVAVEVTGAITPAYVEAAEAAITALIDECATSTQIAPVDCPFAGVLFEEYRDLSWKITDYPVLEIAADGTTYASTDDGRAYASFQQENFSGRGWIEGSLIDHFAMSGTLRYLRGEIRADFDDEAFPATTAGGGEEPGSGR